MGQPESQTFEKSAGNSGIALAMCQGMEVLLIDSNPLFRLALRELIKSAHPGLTVCEVETFADGRGILRENSDIALVMLDMKVPDCGGFVGLFQLRREFAKIPVVLLSTSGNAEAASRAMAFGAAGFILKSASCDAITQTLKTMLSGRVWMPAPIIASAGEANPMASLSPALLRVLAGLKQGLSNKQIAAEMGISDKTVKVYMSTLYRKLGVNSRAQASLIASGGSC
jgi:DNA-binding NarL/FixJ family response regulator